MRGGQTGPLKRQESYGERVDMTVTDEELVARCIAGDTDSFNQLILRWERPIYALAYRQLGREEDARDVVQDAFLRAFRALPGFKGEAKFSSWLYRITLNLCRDCHAAGESARRSCRRPKGSTSATWCRARRRPAESIEDVVTRKDLSRHVARAMSLLPEEQRSAILLKEYHGLTFQEIAELQGCPLSTVKTRLYQGLTVLRRELERQRHDHGTGREQNAMNDSRYCDNPDVLMSYLYEDGPGEERLAFEAHLPPVRALRRRGGVACARSGRTWPPGRRRKRCSTSASCASRRR